MKHENNRTARRIKVGYGIDSLWLKNEYILVIGKLRFVMFRFHGHANTFFSILFLISFYLFSQNNLGDNTFERKIQIFI